MKQKKILFIYPYTDMHTGSPRSMIDLADALDKEAYISAILTPEMGEVSKKAGELGIKTYFDKSVSLSGNNILGFINNFLWFIFFLKKHKINLIHLNGPGWRESAVLSAGFLNIPVILHIRNHYPSEDVKGNFNFKIAKKIVIISQSMTPIFENCPEAQKKIICIYNGIDIKQFSPKKVDLSCRFQDKHRYFIVGFVGQISHRKGLDLLIKAAPSIISNFPHVRFLIIGADGINEPGLTQTYMRVIERDNMMEYFDFLGKREDMPDVMNFIDLLVVPSRKEPFGKVIVEAMACGKCVIASDAGGIPEIIDDQDNGLLFPNGDYNKLGQCIQTAISDNTLREQLALKGQMVARKKFSTDALIHNIQNLYASLI